MKMGFVLIFFWMVSCGPRKEASVSRLSDGVSNTVPVVLNSFTGKRDAYNALAEMTFIDSISMSPLVIRFKLAPGVPTRFISGDYSWQNFAGEVTCTAIDFMGGQGGLPSVAGTFSFTTADETTYIVYLPTTEMVAPK